MRHIFALQQTFTRAVAVLLLALLISTPVAAAKPVKTATLVQCQSLKDRMERYTGLRRKGGSASQMQRLKEQLRASEEQFRRMDCRDHRRKLQ